MQFFSVIGTLATIASLVSATAIPATPEDRQMMGRISNPLLHSSRPGNIAKRDTGLYFCTDADYEGLCYRDKSAAGTCGMCPVLVGLPSCAAIFQEEHS